MFKKILLGLAGTMILAAGANAAHFVELQAPASVTEGDTFTIDIVGDFLSLGFLAGGVQIFYDAALIQIDDFQFAVNVDGDLSCPGAGLCPVDAPGTLSIVWGQFLSDLVPPDNGPTLLGSITATALAPGANRTTLQMVDFSQFTGGWFGSGFVSIDPPELRSTDVQINAIPLPAAVWMMIGGLGALARFRRK